MQSASPLVIYGHRGAKDVAPENTMLGFRRALADGADQLELDVRLSRDGRMVIMHDATVDRTTDGSGAVATMTWRELQRLDAGAGERIPDLPQVWQELAEIGLQVEIKAPAAIGPVLELLRSQPRSAPLMLTSFDAEVVAAALAVPGDCRVGLIGGASEADKIRTGLADFSHDPRFCVLVHRTIADMSEVAAYREQGGHTNTWPVRDTEEVLQILDEGWSGITMDNPAIGVAARKEWLAR